MDIYTIGHVAKLTGLTEFTLRAWERRYGVPLPNRNHSGRRVYASREVEKLKLLKQLTEHGHVIGEIAHLEMPKLSALAKQSGFKNAESQRVQQLMTAIRDCNLHKLSAILRSAQLENDTRTFLLEIVSPTLAEIGSRVAEGELDIYHEHAASSVIRNILSGLFYSIEQMSDESTAETIVFAGPEGDYHEFGILISAILTALQGKRVLYLGPNMPALSLARAIQTSGSSTVVIGCSTSHQTLSASQYRTFINHLSAEVDSSVSFWFGGFRNEDIRSLPSLKKRSVTLMNRYQDLERALKTL
jgi:DNA-binding transcriptional MerR regulator